MFASMLAESGDAPASASRTLKRRIRGIGLRRRRMLDQT